MNNLVQPECGGPNPLVRAANQIGGASKTASLAHMARAAARQLPGSTANSNFIDEFMTQQQQQQQHIQHQTFNHFQQPAQNRARGNWSRQFIGATSHAGPSASNQAGKLAGDFLAERDITMQVQNLSIASPASTTMPPMTFGTNYAYHSTMPNLYQNYQHHQATNQPLNAFQNNQQHQATVSAGDQLDVKYRQDLLSQTHNAQLGTHEMLEAENQSNLYQEQHQETSTSTSEPSQKTDDIEFWQNLAQKYNQNSEISQLIDEKLWFQFDQSEQGEDSSGVHKLPGSDYSFDDTNPLKDQFEDPFAEGIKRLEAGDIPSAVLLFEATVQKDRQHADAWRYLGTTQAQNENDRLAIRALTACLEINPVDSSARFALAVSSANESQDQRACDNLCVWLSQNQKYNHLIDKEKYELCKLKPNPYNDNRVNETAYEYVKEVFISAARLAPNNPDPEIQSALGVLFSIWGEYEKAADCFKAALSVRRQDSLLWNRLGATLANGNKSEEAVAAYRQALKLSPGFLRSRFNLAISCINLCAYKEAAEQLVSILNIQAAGRGLNNSRARSVTSGNIWNTLRTVVTLMNRPELYPQVDGRNLAELNAEFLSAGLAATSSNEVAPTQGQSEPVQPTDI